MSRVSGLAERVRLMVLRGEVAPGGRMVEVHLAEAFEVSRTKVREVLRQLAGEGLLVANHDGGMRVVRLDADELAATLRVRAALEALAAGLAAEHAAAGALAPARLDAVSALAGAGAGAASATGAAAGIDAASATGAAAGIDVASAAGAADRLDAPVAAALADRRFHRALAGLAANRPCQDALDRVWDRLVVAAGQALAPAPGPAAAHGELVAAVAAGLAEEAAALARRHVLAALA